VPCLYDYNAYAFYFSYQGRLSGMLPRLDSKLEKRMSWISTCASLNTFYLHHFDDLKSNSSLYFLESYSIYGEVQTPKGVFIRPIQLERHGCYYLGRWPNYWNVDNRLIVYAHDLMTSRVYALDAAPRIYGETLTAEESEGINGLETKFGKYNLIWFCYPARIPVEERVNFWSEPNGIGTQIKKYLSDVAYFQKESNVVEYLRQKFIFDVRLQRYKTCMDKRFPKPEKPQTTKVKTPLGDQPFTPTPETPVTLPTPTAKPKPAPPKNETKLTYTFDFGLVPKSNDNRFSLNTLMKEEKG
jgi:hypothetical protein